MESVKHAHAKDNMIKNGFARVHAKSKRRSQASLNIKTQNSLTNSQETIPCQKQANMNKIISSQKSLLERQMKR